MIRFLNSFISTRGIERNNADYNLKIIYIYMHINWMMWLFWSDFILILKKEKWFKASKWRDHNSTTTTTTPKINRSSHFLPSSSSIPQFFPCFFTIFFACCFSFCFSLLSPFLHFLSILSVSFSPFSLSFLLFSFLLFSIT